MFIAKVVKCIGALGLAAALTITLAPLALAAVSATLSQTTGQPGDAMTLTTTEWVSAGPVNLVSAGDFQGRGGGSALGALGTMVVVVRARARL